MSCKVCLRKSSNSCTGYRTSRRKSCSTAPPQEKRSIFDAGHTHDLPGKLVRGEGQAAVTDKVVNQAYDGLGDTFDFYLKVYDRNSIDNAGLPLLASVHFGTNYDNAFWN